LKEMSCTGSAALRPASTLGPAISAQGNLSFTASRMMSGKDGSLNSSQRAQNRHDIVSNV